MQTPETWSKTPRERPQDLHMHAKKGWLIIAPIFLLALGAIIQFWFAGADPKKLQSNLVVLSSTDKNNSIQSDTASQSFEIKYPDWKLQSVQEIKMIGEYEDEDIILNAESWSPASDRLIYFLRNHGGSALGNELRSILYTVFQPQQQHQEPKEMLGAEQMSNSKKLLWLDDSRVMLHRKAPVIVDVDRYGDVDETQFQTDERWDSWDVSQDGKHIVAVSENGKIHMIDATKKDANSFVGKRTVKVTAADSGKIVEVPQLIQPSWSQDGKRIAFFKRTNERASLFTDARVEEVDIVLLSVDDLNLDKTEPIAKGFIVKGEKSTMLWSKDSRYVLDQNTGTIYDIKERRISSQGVYKTKQATFEWSKDNVVLRREVTSYASKKDQVYDLVLSAYNPDGSAQKELFRLTGSKVQQSINPLAAQWTSTGNEIVFIADRRLWMISKDGGNLRKLDIPEDDYQQIILSPHDQIILFSTDSKIGMINLLI